MVWARYVYRVIAYVVLAAVVLQFYFAGLAAFGAAKFDAHAVTGWALIPLSVLLTLFAALSRAGRRTVGCAGLGILLFILQPVLAFVPRVDAPAISALHTVNALLIFGLIYTLARARFAES